MRSSYIKRVLTSLPLLAISFTVFAGPAEDGLLESIRVGDAIMEAQIAAAFDENILDHDSVTPLINRVTQLASSLYGLKASNAHLVASHIYWRDGSRNQALEQIDLAIVAQPTPAAVLLKARILDANGDEESAREWYLRGIETGLNAEQQEFVAIRLALMDSDQENVDSLLELAQQRPREFKNRAAIALGVLGHTQAATQIFELEQTDDNYLQGLFSFVQWALTSSDWGAAKDTAWQAYDVATLLSDRFYALTLVEESYRSAGDLQGLIDHIATIPDTPEDLLLLRLDLLRETRQYDAAIDFYTAAGTANLSEEAQDSLIQLYEQAGRIDDMVSAYRQNIQIDPQNVRWAQKLSAHYINEVEPDVARQVWRDFCRQNEDDLLTLTRAGEVMAQMGFDELAVEFLEQSIQELGTTLDASLFLFNHHLRRGANQKAEQELVRLRNSLEPGSGDLLLVADAFERIDGHATALEIYRELETTKGELGYDQRLRKAWLLTMTGVKEEALAEWREIWVGASNPARRSFAESQLLLIAAELNLLGDIVVDLETKLFERTAELNDINLLIRIYTEIGDSFSAAEVIDEYARYRDTDEITKLKQLGSVYLQLQEFDKYETILRQLEQIDTENRLEHIQNIILNTVSANIANEEETQFDEVADWIEALRSFDSEAVSGEFEASVLSMSGFTDHAISSYRRALIEQPTHSDNLLLLADLLKESNRTKEAVSLLQYVAEHATGDNEFVVAIDGIINMIGQRQFGQELSAEDKATFRWTHRVILERITSRETKFYLYRLLADIAQETNDKEAEFLAVESSLAQANIRRAAVLRELVTMSTPGAGFTFVSNNRGDKDRQLKYGRRLIGLRQQLPPEVFIEISRTLLSQGDLIGARRSFDLIQDVTGVLDVTQVSAEMFHEAGFTKEALDQYNKALTTNRDDIELLLRAGALREVTGRDDVAHGLYVEAMDRLLRSQAQTTRTEPPPSREFPFAPQDQDTTVNHEYRRYYSALRSGLISSWPENARQAATAVDLFSEMIQREIEFVQENQLVEPVGRSKYARLRHMMDFAQELSMATSDLKWYEKLANQVDAIFEDEDQDTDATDPESLGLQLRSQEDETTYAKNLIESVEKSGDFEGAIKLARSYQLDDELESLSQAAIESDEIGVGIGYALALWPKTKFRQYYSRLAGRGNFNEEVRLEFLLSNSALASRLEEETGQPLLSWSKFLELVTASGPKSVLGRDPLREYQVVRYIEKSATIDQKLDYFEVVFQQPTNRVAYTRANDITALLREDLNREQRERISALLKTVIDGTDTSDEFSVSGTVGAILEFDLRRDNAGVLYAAADRLENRLGTDLNIRETIRNHLRGRGDDVIDQLLDWSMDTSFGQASWITRSLLVGQREEATSRLQDYRDGSLHDSNRARLLLEVVFDEFRYAGFGQSLDSSRLDEFVQAAKDLRRQYPEDERFAMHQILGHVLAGQLREATAELSDYYQKIPNDELARAALYFLLIQQQQYLRALTILDDGKTDLRVPEEVEKLAASRRFGSGLTSESVFSLIHGRTRFANITNYSKILENSLTKLRAVTAETPSIEVAQELRNYWRTKEVAQATQDRGFYGRRAIWEEVLDLPIEEQADDVWFDPYTSAFSSVPKSLEELLDEKRTTHSLDLVEHLATLHPLGSELERLSRSIPESERFYAERLYQVTAAAYLNDGTASDRLEEVEDQLLSGNKSSHDLKLWLALVDELQVASPQGTATRILANMPALEEMSNADLVQVSGWLARSDRESDAFRVFRLVGSRLTKFEEFAAKTPFGGARPRQTSLGLTSLLQEASAYLSETNMESLIEAVIATSVRADADDALLNLYMTFALRAMQQMYTADRTLAQFDSRFDVASYKEAPSRVRTLLWVERARLHALAGESERALELIHEVLTEPTTTKATDHAERMNIVAHNVKREQLQALGQVMSSYQIYLPLPSGPEEVEPSKLQYLMASRERLVEDLPIDFLDDLVTYLIDLATENATALEFLMVLVVELDTDSHTELVSTSLAKIESLLLNDSTYESLAAKRNFAQLQISRGGQIHTDLLAQLVEQNVLSVEDQATLLNGLPSQTIIDDFGYLLANPGTDSLGLSVASRLIDILGSSSNGAEGSPLRERRDALLVAAEELELDLPAPN